MRLSEMDPAELKRVVLGVSERDARFISAIESGRLQSDVMSNLNDSQPEAAGKSRSRGHRPPAPTQKVFIQDGDRTFATVLGMHRVTGLLRKAGSLLRLQPIAGTPVVADSIGANTPEAELRVIERTDQQGDNVVLTVRPVDAVPSRGTPVSALKVREIPEGDRRGNPASSGRKGKR